MKYIVTILFLCFWFNSFSQYTIQQGLGSSSTQVTAKGALGAKDGLVFTQQYTDTTEANNFSPAIRNIAGFLIRVNSTELWIRNELTTAWVRIGAGSTGAINGVNLSGSNVKLGGDLIETTTIGAPADIGLRVGGRTNSYFEFKDDSSASLPRSVKFSTYIWDNIVKISGHNNTPGAGAVPREQLVIDNPNSTGTTTQAMIGFSTYDGTQDSIRGWVGFTGNSYTFAPYPNAMYIESFGTGGLKILSDHPTLGDVDIYTGGYIDTSFRRFTVKPNGSIYHYANNGTINGTNFELTEEVAVSQSFFPLNFRVPTTGLSAQIISTANNYVGAASINIPANSLGILSEATGGSLSLIGGTSTSDIRFTVGGYTSASERMRITNTGVSGALFSATTSLTSPLIIGGTSTTSDLNLRTTSGVGAAGADMHFQVGNNGATEAMTILNSGFIGVNNTSPTSRFHLSSSGGLNTGINLNLTAAASYAPIDFNTLSGLNGQFLSTGASYSAGAFTGDELALASELASGKLHLAAIGASGIIKFTTGGNTTGNERMRITSAGLVGVGVTGPTAKIEIAAGSTTANTAPLEFNSGSTETTIRAGLHQYNGQHYVSNVALNQMGVGGAIKDFIADSANTGTTEEFLYRYTTKASTLASDGEKITGKITLILTDATADKVVKLYFADTEIFSTGTMIATTGTGVIEFSIIRTSSSTARATVLLNFNIVTGATGTVAAEADLTGLTFTNTYAIAPSITLSGVGAGAGDATFKMGTIFFYPASNN